ncbi:Crp/Fnr family transcriptional regulator [Gellertiella hungarica]|uniref:CRP-like cAMP-binding protein n=1 Tax=Gellertiella hungarica TaxID=1572859 RepID=A0A7W6NLR8_9HYPH|nr:Crp/Fnr family transcriptional regulator [Gellertiella hungarica]MBB4065617.1 CRP-like cAMP-binding protein [Gellertiella hungarica]
MQHSYANRLLALLPASELSVLAPLLEHVDLPKSFSMASPERPIQHVYFLEQGLGSIVSVSPEGQRAEAGMFGYEGFAPTPPAAHSAVSFHETTMQAPGHGNRIKVTDFWEVMRTCPQFSELLHRSTHNLATQVSYTALANAVHHVDERLGRWLLMCHDRLRQDELLITHEFIALMLAVRRPSVTTSLHVLEGNRFIRAERGRIIIRNRRALEEFAQDAYGRPEAEYSLLFSDMQPVSA